MVTFILMIAKQEAKQLAQTLRGEKESLYQIGRKSQEIRMNARQRETLASNLRKNLVQVNKEYTQAQDMYYLISEEFTTRVSVLAMH